jgi:hypothetical protein
MKAYKSPTESNYDKKQLADLYLISPLWQDQTSNNYHEMFHQVLKRWTHNSGTHGDRFS